MKSKMKTLKLAAFLGAITVATAGFGFANVTAFADENDVAKIEGGQSYATLAEAFNATVDGDTVTLLSDLTINTETYTIPDGKNIVLNMNDKTITVTDTKTTGNYELFYIYGGMEVTGNGTIELTATTDRDWNAMSTIFHNRGGVLTIENGTFKNLGGTDMAWVIDNSGNYYGDATTTINGGTFFSSYTAIRNRMEQNSHGASGKAILNVNGGNIDGTTSAIWAQAASTSTTAPATGEINISGGDIGVVNTARSEGAECMTTISGGNVEAFKGEVGELTLSGGSLGKVTVLTAEGQEADFVVSDYLTADATVEINGSTYGNIAQVGNQKYKTIQDAIDNTIGSVDITLLGNAVGAGVVIDRVVTIDFNGYTYTVDNGVDIDGTSCGFYITERCSLYNGCIAVDENSGVDVAVLSKATTGEDVSLRFLSISAGNATALVARNAYTYVEGESTIESNSNTVPTILVKDSDSGDRVQLIVKAFEGTPRINGRMDVEGENIVVTLMAGEFNGNICSNDTKNVRVSGGKYATDVTQYVVEGKALEQEGEYFVVVDDNQQGGGNDQPGGGPIIPNPSPERPDGLTDEQWMAILGVLGALNNSQNNGAQTNDSEVAAPANNTAAVVIAIVASSLVVLIVAAAVVLWILEKKEIFKISKYFKD
ncbi:MAG: hypothetical protein IJX75_00815 [Clostridia bacterium]|nr:hypothetical protein [Clostridia bacterium]